MRASAVDDRRECRGEQAISKETNISVVHSRFYSGDCETISIPHSNQCPVLGKLSMNWSPMLDFRADTVHVVGTSSCTMEKSLLSTSRWPLTYRKFDLQVIGILTMLF